MNYFSITILEEFSFRKRCVNKLRKINVIISRGGRAKSISDKVRDITNGILHQHNFKIVEEKSKLDP